MLRKFVLILVACGVMTGAAACNTVKGMGRDIESVGQAGDDAIHHH
jgi:predicted small secreted protein